MTVPNLDAMLPADLMMFWHQYSRASREESLFLLGKKFPGYIGAVKALANYASNKATAMQCRLRGDIPAALTYETICDNIYAALPPCARW